MAKRPYMPMYWKDYLSDTQHLTAEEHGVYLLLIAHYWTTGEPLPAGDMELQKFCKNFAKISTYRWKKIEPVIRKFFVRDGGVLRHKRIDKELARSAEISRKRKDSVARRWQKDHAGNGYDGIAEVDTKVSPDAIPYSYTYNTSNKYPQSRKPRARALEAPRAASPSAFPWRELVHTFQSTGRWLGPGPAPDLAGCRAPDDVLREFGFMPHSEQNP